MKKTDPAIERGKQNEERFIALTRSLRTSHPWVRSVRKTTRTLDDAGVDAIVFLASPVGGPDIKVPVQVKSSSYGAKNFRLERPECIEAGVITVIVNDYRSDEDLKAVLLDFFARARTRGTDYDEFLSEARRGAKNVREQFKGRGKQTRQHRLWELTLAESKSLLLKGGCV